MERIANSLDDLTIWFEEIDKDEWSSRVQYYLAEFHNKIVKEITFEGGKEVKESIERILSAGVPVMGHLGLTPQSIYKFGTYVVRAREEEEAKRLIDDANLLDTIGCFAVVLEKIPAALAKRVASQNDIPFIGIGAGGDVDGQVLVGRVVEESPEKLVLRPNPLEDKTVTIVKSQIETRSPSKVSPMPVGLLNTFSKEDILDLLAYMLAADDPKDPAFKHHH